MNGTRDSISIDSPVAPPRMAGARPGPQTVQVVRRLRDDVCFSQESRGREEDDAAQSLCSTFMAAWD